MIGRTVDHYRVESKLGEGGMGVVYKARDTHLDRPVAIKVLPADKVADPIRKQRFVQEAKAASALNHPNIVTVYDIRSENDLDLIVMEFIDGQTLAELIGPKGMRTAHALKYGVQIADALAKAHGVGIIHRDLKPSNIMVTDEGHVKVLDFGLAKLLEATEFSPDAPTLTTPGALTEEGTAVGTASYMSPEQAEGRKLDARSDIFSFGSLLYEAVTGRKPFTGDSWLAILSKILNEDPTPPGKLAASIPPELEKILLRCLRKDPARRYQTMADLKVALEDLQSDSVSVPQQTPVPTRPPWWGARWTWAAMFGLLAFTTFVVWKGWSARERMEPLRATALTTFPGQEQYPSFSPDGNHVAFTWDGLKQDNRDLYVQMIGTNSPLRLTTDARRDYSPVWSPNGRWIAFLRGQPSNLLSPGGKSELLVIAPLGGPERKVADVQTREISGLNALYVDWCPDSTCLVVADSMGEGKPDAIFVITLDTEERRQLTNPQPPVLGDTNPVVAPNGRSLILRRSIAPDAGELHWVPLAKNLTVEGETRRLTLATLNAVNPTWMPDGKQILFSARGSLWRLSIEGENVPARLPFVGEDGLMPVVSRSQSGRLPRLTYVRRLNDWNIWRVETSAVGTPSLSPPAIAISSTRLDLNAHLSPDGRRVAFGSNRSGDTEVWLADLDGSNAVQLTFMSAQMTGSPRWSPDGQLIAFDSNVEGQSEVYIVSASGGKPRRLTFHRANDHVPSFSRDGKWIYFSSNRNGQDQIWKIPSAGGEAMQVTQNIGYVAFDAPDGSSVYYTQTAGTPSALWRVPSSGGQPVKVLDGVVMRAFVALEKGIYYIGRSAGEARLEFFDFGTGASRTVARNLGNVTLGLTASADGRTILYSRVDSSTDDLMLVEDFR